MLQDRKATSDAIRKARPRTRPNSWLKGADSIEPPIVRRQRLRADIPCWSGRPPTASNMPGCGVSTTQLREPPNDDYQDWPGYLQACLSGAWRRPERAAGIAPASAAQRDGEVLRQLPATRIGPEACGASHHWARVLGSLGLEVVLMPPQYIKPYVKRGKTDAIDAAAICEAMSRPGMRFVPVKSAESQAVLMVLRVRDLLVKQRTTLINAIRGHAAEFGVSVAKGPVEVTELLQHAHSEAAKVPARALEMLSLLAGQLDAIETRLKTLEAQPIGVHKANPTSQCLATIPGVGPIGAVSFALRVPDPKAFRSGRHLAAWLGLTPKENSTAGRHRPGRISRQGDANLRRLLVLGATAVIRCARPGRASPWLLHLLARRPKKLAAVALANKMARIIWAMMVSGETYRRPQQA